MEKSYLCYHCNQKLGKTSYFEHKKKYYCPSTNTWQTNTVEEEPVQCDEFHFSDDDQSLGDGEPCLQLSNEPSDEGDQSSDDETSEEENVDARLTEVWFDSSDSNPDDFLIESPPNSKPSQVVRFYIMFLLMWQSVFKLSDSGMTVLFLYLSTFLSLFLSTVTVPTVRDFVNMLPKSVSSAKKLIGIVSDPFIKYVSCPKCHSLYNLNTCKIVNPDRSISSRLCSYVMFPNHPHAHQRLPCNAQLMKMIKTSSGSISLYPQQIFCYQNIVEALRNKILTPGFIEQTELWRKRTIPASCFTYVYDGAVWKEFLAPDGVPFLSAPYNFALALNIDWFQPFKHSTYSLGAMYVAILNLPRTERYSTSNVILLGIIPGPSEPKKDCNSYLRPFVNELMELWNGVVMKNSIGMKVFVRAALICVACDIPASRKVSGFVGHNALRACSRCLKEFPTENFGDKADFTGVDRSTWPPRSLVSHRHSARKHRDSRTKSQQKMIEREHGCRYSVLVELPYFDVIRHTIVDPMHNLLLGTAKHVLNVWVTRGIIEKEKFYSIQQRVDSFVTPSDVGRIPAKIASGFSGFTAEQWRNWVLLYSLCSLKSILPHKHYDCWLLFVKAVSLLCKRQITLKEVETGDTLLIEFCECFERLYGKESYNINLHLHGHLRECIHDYGPVYSFWLFSYERMNGILGSFHTNCHDISLQIMRRYVTHQNVSISHWPAEFQNKFAPLLVGHSFQKGSLKSYSLAQALEECRTTDVEPIPPVVEDAWEPVQKVELKSLVASLVGHEEYSLLLLHQKAFALTISGFVIGSVMSRHKTKSHVMAVHPQFGNLHLAKIEHFCRVEVKDNLHQVCNCYWVVCVSFYDPHACRVWFGGPTQVWCRSLTSGSHYIKLSSVKSRVAYSESEVDFGRHIGKQTVIISSALTDYSS